jgi:hypothetical protein
MSTYAVFSLTEIDKINFSEVLETSMDTLRKNTDNTKSFFKWNGDQPSFTSTLETFEGPYTNSEILNILSGDEWNYESCQKDHSQDNQISWTI